MATHSEDEQDNILMNGIASDRLTSDYVSVSQFYSGRSVFITGGTGFMGKVSVYSKNPLNFSLIHNIYGI